MTRIISQPTNGTQPPLPGVSRFLHPTHTPTPKKIKSSSLLAATDDGGSEGHGDDKVEGVDDDKHRDNGDISMATFTVTAEGLRYQHRRLIAEEPSDAPGGKHGAVNLGDIGHAIVVSEDCRNHREPRAVAGIDDEEREADHWRPERTDHDARGDAEDEKHDVDAGLTTTRKGSVRRRS